MKVGFIGLGTLGAKMAANVQQAGHALTVHDLSPSAGDTLVADGAVWAPNPRAVAEQVDIVLTSLPGPPQVEDVALGEQGVLAGLRPDCPHFDLSTNASSMVRRIAAAYAEHGRQFLDTPVSGGPAAALQRKLTLWVSGDAETAERFKPVVESVGAKLLHVGPVGTATITKLVNNCAAFGLTALLAEVFTMGVKAGADPLALFTALRHGALGGTRTYDGLINQFLPGVFDPASFALRLAHKDVALATELGAEVGVPMRMANLMFEELTQALARGWGDRDTRAFTLLQQERAGVRIEVDRDRLKAAVANDR
jgi:3-hydroxyisobutyrate dehydrogenase-like beta-hydroxyacid dehydrogenase